MTSAIGVLSGNCTLTPLISRARITTGWPSAYSNAMDTGPAFHVRVWDIIISITVADPRGSAYSLEGGGSYAETVYAYTYKVCEHNKTQAFKPANRKHFFRSNLSMTINKSIHAKPVPRAPLFPSLHQPIQYEKARPQWTGLAIGWVCLRFRQLQAALSKIRARRLRPRCHWDRHRNRTPASGSARNPCGRSSPYPTSRFRRSAS